MPGQSWLGLIYLLLFFGFLLAVLVAAFILGGRIMRWNRRRDRDSQIDQQVRDEVADADAYERSIRNLKRERGL